jgi:hypothetical protein
VLASVNQPLDDVLARLERIHHRRHFDEIWASAYDVKYVHRFSDQRQPRLIYLTTTARVRRIWSGWDGVGTAAVTLVGPIAYFTRVCWHCMDALQRSISISLSEPSAEYSVHITS